MKKYSILLIVLLCKVQLYAQIEEPNVNNVTINERHIEAERSYLGAKAVGKYSAWYGCGNSNQQRGHIAKPFIWVEGINLTPNNIEKSNRPAYSELYHTLMLDGFDIIQLDFDNNPQWIQRNAELLITLIHQIQAEMDANFSRHEIVIMGESMGAVLIRYALAKMENDGENHNVRLFISYDGPHHGANVPYGLQYFANELLGGSLRPLIEGISILSGITDSFAGLFGEDGVSSVQAAFQLLRDSPEPLSATLRISFLMDLLSKGNYPSQCRKIALANGANNGFGIQVDGDNHQILRLEFITATGISDWRAFAAPGVEINALGIDWGSRIVFGKFSSAIINSKVLLYPVGKENWDVSPGGTYFEDGPVVAGVVGRTRPFCFVPTVSALGLNTNNPFYNVATEIPNFGQVIPNVGYTFDNPITEFDAVWADWKNDPHVINFDGESNIEDFIIEEVSPDNLVIQNKIVTDGQRKIYEARNRVTLGRNISSAFPVGNVVFQDGSNVRVRAGNEIVWANGFNVQGGATADFFIDFYDCE